MILINSRKEKFLKRKKQFPSEKGKEKINEMKRKEKKRKEKKSWLPV
jgi:hypothetical protein